MLLMQNFRNGDNLFPENFGFISVSILGDNPKQKAEHVRDEDEHNHRHGEGKKRLAFLPVHGA
ncbi:hypothetical protein D1872_296730 [compost metagenome]